MADDGIHHQWHHVVPGHGVSQYMERVQQLLDHELTPPPVRTVTRAPRSIADANDEWVAQRAMAEQIVSEANAMLGDGRPKVELVDELGRPDLTFVVRGPGGWLRVTMHAADGLAWLGCEGSLPSVPDGAELAEPQVLEDVVLHLIGA
jgi:hypothetical protein